MTDAADADAVAADADADADAAAPVVMKRDLAAVLLRRRRATGELTLLQQERYVKLFTLIG